MLTIKTEADVARISHPLMRQVVEASLSRILADHPGFYEPAGHGWFMVLEDSSELDETSALHGQFSVRQIIRGQGFEWMGRYADFIELVVALNDSEAVAVYVPLALLQDADLMAVIAVAGVPA